MREHETGPDTRSQRQGRRWPRRLAIATIVLVVPCVGGVKACGWLLGDGPPAPGALQPHPDGFRVLEEVADCPGNGNGWLRCHRTLRVRPAGLELEGVEERLVAHYRSQGFVLEPLSKEERCRIDLCDAPAFGEPGCMDQAPSGRVRCLYVHAPIIEMRTWTYRR